MIQQAVLLDEKTPRPAIEQRIAYHLANGAPVYVAPLWAAPPVVRWVHPGGDDPRQDHRRWPTRRGTRA